LNASGSVREDDGLRLLAQEFYSLSAV